MTLPNSASFRDRMAPWMRVPELTSERRWLTLTGGAVAAGHDDDMVPLFSLALAEGVSGIALAEIALQTYLFAGYPRAINGLMALRSVTPRHRPRREDPTPSLAVCRERGETLCATIYGSHYQRLRTNIEALHPDLDRWMVDEGYGRVLSRPGVHVIDRELAALSALVVLGVDRQVRSHLAGSRHVGAEDAEIAAVLAQCQLFTSEDNVARAGALWSAMN